MIRWSVAGTDGSHFTINQSGEFSFKETDPPDFEQPGDSGSDNIYDVEIQAKDEDGIAASLPVMVTVREVNEGPEVTSGQATFTVTENQDLPNAVYTGFDPEGGTVTRWTVGGRDGGDFTITQDGVLTFRNLPDHERPADGNRDNVYELEVRPYDGRYYGSFDVTVTVNDVNEPPTITTTSSSATVLRQSENRTSRLYSYRATDPEGGSTIRWSVGGTDRNFFAINERGEFSFATTGSPDFEQPGDAGGNNVYNVTVQVSDDSVPPNTASLPVTVTVTDVNEGPEITSGGSRFTVQENQDLAGANFTASDPEQGTVARWNLGGRDGGDFTITENGVMAFRSPPDYERPVDSDRNNIYEVEIRPYDGRYYGSHHVTVTVTPINEAPDITTTSSSATGLRQQENRTSRLYTYRATDPENRAIRWSVTGTHARFFTINERGELFFSESNPPDYENRQGTGSEGQRIPGDGAGQRWHAFRQSPRNGHRHRRKRGACSHLRRQQVHRPGEPGLVGGQLHRLRPGGGRRNPLEPGRPGRRRLHHQRDGVDDLPEHPRPRASGGLGPEQHLRGGGTALRREVLRFS